MASSPRTTLAGRVFRFLILLFPSSFRRRFGLEMSRAFDRSLHDARGQRGFWGMGLGMIMDLLVTLPKEWIDTFRREPLPWSPGPSENVPRSRDGGIGLDFLRQDLRIGARSFVRQPGFTLVSVAMIALGIGATTTIFSVVDGVLLRELPYPRPTELVFFQHGDHPPERFRAWRESSRSFTALGAARNRGFDMVGDGEPERLKGALVTTDFLSMFGAVPAVGRLFVSSDFFGEPRVAVLTHGFW